MPDNPSAPPDSDGSGTDAEQAAWEMATAETHRARGELAQAATWYRRAANHLMEAGEDERAISIAKLAAELAALDDAGRAPRERARSEPASSLPSIPGPERSRAPVPVAPAAASVTNAARPANPAAVSAPAAPRPRPPSLAGSAGTSVTAPRPALSAATAASVVSKPVGPPPPPPPPPRAGAQRAAPPPPPPPPAVAPAGHHPSDPPTSPPPPLRPPSGKPSPIAALVDEAVSNIEELPPSPLSPMSNESSRRPMSFSPARAAEAERIATRLPALPLFSDLPPERLRDLGRESGVVRLNAAEPLCEAGAPEGPLFVILEGSAWVGLAGENSPAAIATAGDFIGEVSALYGGPRTASVFAQGTMEVVALPPSLVRALSREFPPFRDTLRDAARERLSESLPRVTAMLRRLDPAARKEVFRHFEILHVDEGEALLLEGDPAAWLYVVAGGEVELYGGELGHNRTHRARVGEALGVASMVTGEPSGVSARAPRDVMVARIARAAFREVLAQYPELSDAASDVGVPGRGVVC